MHPKDLPNLFNRAVILNTNSLPDGELDYRRLRGHDFFRFLSFNAPFLAFQATHNLFRQNLPFPLFYKICCSQGSTDPGFIAPYLRKVDRGGVVSFPLLVPVYPSDRYATENRRTREFLAHGDWKQENTLILFSRAPESIFDKGDVVVGNRKTFYHILMPRAKSAPTIEDAGHLVMHDNPQAVAHYIVKFISSQT